MTLASTTDISAGFADSWLRDVLAAVHGVLGLPRSPLPLHEPEFAGREWQYVKECLDTGWVSSAGAYVDRFERDLCSYTGAAHAIATANGNKVVTTGGGGALLTNDAVLGRRAKHLTTTARIPHRWSFLHDQVGYNYRLPNLNAALGCAQLEQLPAMIQRKRQLAARYCDAFNGVSGVKFLREPPGTSSNYWLNAIVLDAAHEAQRDSLLAALND